MNEKIIEVHLPQYEQLVLDNNTIYFWTILDDTNYLVEVICSGALLVVNIETTNELCGDTCNLTCNASKCRHDW